MPTKEAVTIMRTLKAYNYNSFKNKPTAALPLFLCDWQWVYKMQNDRIRQAAGWLGGYELSELFRLWLLDFCFNFSGVINQLDRRGKKK